MVFNVTFNNISVISRRSVLLVEQTGEDHRPVANHCQSWNYVNYCFIIIRQNIFPGSFSSRISFNSRTTAHRLSIGRYFCPTDRILCSRCVSLKIMRMDGLFTLRLEFMFLIYYLLKYLEKINKFNDIIPLIICVNIHYNTFQTHRLHLICQFVFIKIP